MLMPNIGGIQMKYEDLDKSSLINLLRQRDREIEELKSNKILLEKYAYIDDMTGVLNRRAGLDILKKTIENNKQLESCTTVCFIDVDGLKKVNDRYGHPEGDRLLIIVSDILKKNVRTSDILFRLGGDEFFIVFPSLNKKKAYKVIERINEKIDEINETKKYKYKISLSIGLYEYCDEEISSVYDIIEKADLDMYKRKTEKDKLRRN